VTNPRDILRGAGYGTVQGAGEVGANVAQAATQAVEAAKEAAHEMGLPEDEAAAQAVQGALEAAEPLGPTAVAKVIEALSSGRVDIQSIPNADES
jgi:hypothetical protein